MSCTFYKMKNNDFYCVKKQDYISSDIYYKYCRNFNYDECPIYKEEYSNGCYITSACMYAMNKTDDCKELMILRDFRDNWLMKQSFGEKAIKEYYSIAPSIVSKINMSDDCIDIYKNIYEEMILQCIGFISNQNFEKAYELYLNKTNSLKETYL